MYLVKWWRRVCADAGCSGHDEPHWPKQQLPDDTWASLKIFNPSSSAVDPPSALIRVPAADAKSTSPLIKDEAGDIQDVGKATQQATRRGLVRALIPAQRVDRRLDHSAYRGPEFGDGDSV
jgi:hypothetical protein